MIPNKNNSRWLTLAGLALLVILSAYLRIEHLDARSMTHPEMWVPNIPMPEGLSDPRQRLTVWKVLTGTFSTDTHPPFFYVLMWAWTKCFGIGIWSIRLPAALLGTACVPLTFWLGSLAGQRTAGWLGAGLLAVNGSHVFWSRVARMFSLACFLGLLATILLLLLARETRPQRTLRAAYVLVILIGLATHVFFWALFLTHVVWTFTNSWGKSRSIPDVFKLQILTLILGSPLLAAAVYQSGSPVAILSSKVLLYAREFVQFSFLFPHPGVAALFPSSPLDSAGQFPVWVGDTVFVVFSLFLLVLGTMSTKRSNEIALTKDSAPYEKLWIPAAGFAVLAIMTFVFAAKKFVVTPNDTLRVTKFLVIVPVLLITLGWLIFKIWSRVPNWLRDLLTQRFFLGSQGLLNMLAAVPFVILSTISLFKPILNQRGMLLLAPYILLVLAAGIASLAHKPWGVASIAVLLGILHLGSLSAYRSMKVDPADFRAFAATLAPRVNKSDLIFLQTNWSVTPIFYYLTDDHYRFIGRGYREASQQRPVARVWALFFYQQGMTKELAEALGGYQVLQTVEMPYARAELYGRKEPPLLQLKSSMHDSFESQCSGDDRH